MLPDDVLVDLLTSATSGLQREPFVGLNEATFHTSMPYLPFGEAEVRAAALYLRQHGIRALAIRLQCGNVVDHVLIAGRTQADLHEGHTAMLTGLAAQMPDASLTVFDAN